MCFGDCNEILRMSEKEGSLVRPRNKIAAFQEALWDCGLFNLSYAGRKYTWCNNCKDSSQTRLRLDRAIVNGSWRDLFREANVLPYFPLL